ncbi:uncharacterized protein LOC129230404 [Uloborus diversus]|uniref:uncharacterized protein LOC129230404 n=1 Tax=Uloborus diversus TaxID=327109 RepID=UPI00240A71ED|nr:uncharacterized protein LOC129230404 [Uloborus diversus]
MDQVLFFGQNIRDAHNLSPTNHTIAAFLDLSKAFDRVWKNKLICKLHTIFNISGKMLPWLADFLRARYIRVKFRDIISSKVRLSQGIPQGSVLSPTLFSLFITGIEIGDNTKKCTGLYADDIIIWSTSGSLTTAQEDINYSLVELEKFAIEHKIIFNPSKSVANPLSDLFAVAEVKKALRNAENSAPGPDRLTYQHWKSADPDAVVLTEIFNTCLRLGRIPTCWKDSTTILIPKGGDAADPRNWRPIALSQTSYKLFTKCITARLTSWCASNEVLSPCQKGFTPHDGVLDHNFVLESSLSRARRAKSELCVAWLDVSNAFGSLSHNAIFKAVEASGAGPTLLRLVKDIYSDCSTRFLSTEGVTDAVRISAGVKQGCPLSGMLFNLALDPAIRRIQGDCSSHRILAFADDLVLLDEDPARLQASLSSLSEDLKKIGLQLSVGKSATLHFSGATPVGARATAFKLDNQPIRSLKESDFQHFLGKPVGFNLVPDFSSLNEAINIGQKICSSKLAPWQRIDAMKSFFFPSLQFAMRMGTFPKEAWTKIDQHFRKPLKDTLSLPSRASNDYLYGHRKSGCLGIPLLAEDSDLHLVDSAFKLLTSLDSAVADLALQDLKDAVQKRARSPPTLELLGEYLSGSMDGPFRKTSNDVSNLWARTRCASRRIGITWSFPDGVPEITFRGSTLRKLDRRRVLKVTRDMTRKEHAAKLLACPNQGKVLECVAASPASSHFFPNGAYTRFADWRFVHRARLNLLPLNAAKPWKRGADSGCRRCPGTQETLPHVLEHCMRNSAAYQRRHNAIVDRIKKAAATRFTILGENQQVDPSNLRPDLVLQKGSTVLILDVTIPFENRLAAFETARQAKLQKYQPTAEFFKSSFANVQIVPVLVGALGTWDPKNDKCLQSLCSRSYLKLMRKLCVSDTISWSRDIYTEHITNVRQYGSAAAAVTTAAA